MADPIVIQLQARGVAELQGVFRGVEQTIIAFERNVGAAGERGTRARVSAAQREGADREKAYAKLSREAEKWERQTAAATERLAKEASRAAERSAQEQVRAVEKAEQEKQRAAEKSARAMAAIRERSATMAGQHAVREADRQIAESQRVYEARKAFARSIGGNITGSIGGAVHGIVGAGRGIASAAMQVGGGFSVVDAVTAQANLERQSTLLANKAILPSGARASGANIMSTVKAAAIETGTDADKLLGAWGAYTDKTGDFQGGEKNLRFFGKLAKATGSDLGQIATTAGLLRVQNKQLGEGAMKQLLLDTVAAGRSGSVDMPELASHASAITKTSSSYAGTQIDNQRKLLGLAQIGVRTGSVSEAATMLSNISGDATKHHGAIEHVLGKGTFNAKGQIAKGPDEFIADVLEKSGGNRMKIQGMGFGQRSLKMFDALLPTFNQAEEAALAGGASKADATKAGRKAVVADMQQFTGATMTEQSLNRDFAAVMKTSAEQFEGAVRQLREAIGTQLLPEFVKLIPVLMKFLPTVQEVLAALVRFATWFADNPIKGVGAVVLAKISADLANAAIGEAVKRALVALIAGNKPPVPGGGGPTPPGTAPIVAAGMLAQGALLYKAGSETAGAVLGGKEKGENIAAMLASSDPSKRAEGQKLYDDAKKNSGTIDKANATGERAGTIGAALINPIGAVAKLGVESAVSAATGTKTQSEKSLQTLEANEIVNTVELRKRVADAVAGGVADGMASKAGTADGAKAPHMTTSLGGPGR